MRAMSHIERQRDIIDRRALSAALSALADDAGGEPPRAKVVEILRSPDLRARLAAGGRHLVEERYDWAVVGQRFLSLVEHSSSKRSFLR